MNINNNMSYKVMPNVVAPNDDVSQIPSTILFQLLQNFPKINNNLIVLSPPKIDDQMSMFTDYDTETSQSSTVFDTISQSQMNEIQVPFSMELFKKESSSSVSSSYDESLLEKYNSISFQESVNLNPKKRLIQRHLKEKFTEESKSQSDNCSESISQCSPSLEAPFGRGKNGKPLTRSPFIPSYMDPKSGPFPCKVCGYKSSGLHYKVMACEGCKGFFRRSVQKNLNYVCKLNNKCQINSNNRTKCQQCRWVLCIEAGMDVASVLNDDERRTKNNLIKANRQKRNQVNQGITVSGNSSNNSKSLLKSLDAMETSEIDEQTQAILNTIDVVTNAYIHAFMKEKKTAQIIRGEDASQEIANRVTTFTKLLPGMNKICQVTQSTLLQNRCLDIICLYTVFTFDCEKDQLKLPSGRIIGAEFVKMYKHIEPLWNFAKRTSKYHLTISEKAVLAGLAFIVNNNLESLESIYNGLLAALDHLMTGQSLRNSKLLIMICSDLHILTSRLFELEAPLGRQLLFDFEYTAVKPASDVISIVPQTIDTDGEQSTAISQFNDNRNGNLSNKVAIAPLVKRQAPTIFAFSYGGRHL